MSLAFSSQAQHKLDSLVGKYPNKQPALLAALHLAQKEFGHLSEEVMRMVGQTLDVPYPHVYGVATFYTMFRLEPGGTDTLRVCTNIACMLRGGYDVLEALESKLGLKAGSSDEQFSLVEEECIAACANAPAIVCGTRYFLDVTVEQIDAIVEELRARPRPESEVA